MRSSSQNAIVIKSKKFGVRSIRLYQWLTQSRKEYTISRQILRSGTSIGANVKEAIRGQSKADFGAKMNIALKEASESEYWIELLYETNYLTNEEFQSIISDCRELIRILTAIVKSTFNQ